MASPIRNLSSFLLKYVVISNFKLRQRFTDFHILKNLGNYKNGYSSVLFNYKYQYYNYHSISIQETNLEKISLLIQLIHIITLGMIRQLMQRGSIFRTLSYLDGRGLVAILKFSSNEVVTFYIILSIQRNLNKTNFSSKIKALESIKTYH
jgi:ATP-dependent protease Clp ATPase subunit